jgi:tetratricopeptide (TPR) repeat protein
MKTRTLALDRRDVRQLWEAGRERARQLLRQGRPDRAIEADRALAAAFSGLTDVSEATAEAGRLAGSESARRLEREEARLAAEERRYRKGLGSVWVEIRSPGEALPLARLLRRLDVDALRRRAAGGSGSLDAQAAGRMLSEVFAQTSFYLPRGFLEAKNPGRAALCLSIAARIRPEDPDVWYELASAQARAGSRREAIESLEESVRRGFTRADLLERDEAFAAIRGDPSFRGIVERLSGSPSPPG